MHRNEIKSTIHSGRVCDLQWCDRTEYHEQMNWMEEQVEVDNNLAEYSDKCEEQIISA